MKGLFIPEITAEMFRNGCLESIEALMAEGEICDIDYEPEPKWIPVTERLPEYGDKVLVTFHNKYIDRTTIGVSCCYVQKEGFFSDTPFDYAPIAWMPLPEPYERSEDAEID